MTSDTATSSTSYPLTYLGTVLGTLTLNAPLETATTVVDWQRAPDLHPVLADVASAVEKLACWGVQTPWVIKELSGLIPLDVPPQVTSYEEARRLVQGELGSAYVTGDRGREDHRAYFVPYTTPRDAEPLPPGTVTYFVEKATGEVWTNGEYLPGCRIDRMTAVRLPSVYKTVPALLDDGRVVVQYYASPGDLCGDALTALVPGDPGYDEARAEAIRRQDEDDGPLDLIPPRE